MSRSVGKTDTEGIASRPRSHPSESNPILVREKIFGTEADHFTRENKINNVLFKSPFLSQTDFGMNVVNRFKT
jgi:hypothetical protein